MIYPFGKGSGHLPLPALRVAEELGVNVRNSFTSDAKPMHWLSIDMPENIGALAWLARIEHVLHALAPWRLEEGVDATIASCKEHGRALICPACRGAAGGRIGGKTLSKKRLAQLRRIAKKKRPGARGPRKQGGEQ